MGGGDDVGPGLVDRRVDHERRPVHRLAAVDDVAVVVDEDEVADAHVPEAETERVDPEVVGELGVAHGDVAGDALAEAEAAEDAQRAGELLLAVQALLLDRGERLRSGEASTCFGVSSTPSIVLVGCSSRSWRERVPLDSQAGENGRVNRIVTPDRHRPARRPLRPRRAQRGPGAAAAHGRRRAASVPMARCPTTSPSSRRSCGSTIAAILGEAGMAMTDIVSMTTYVVAGEDLAPVMAARDDDGRTWPRRPS